MYIIYLSYCSTTLICSNEIIIIIVITIIMA
jgi:hypothetical protein